MDGEFSKRLFDLGCHFVEPTMQWTQLATVLFESQRTTRNPSRRIDGADHLKNCQLFLWACQNEPAVVALVRADDPGATQHLKHLGQIPHRHMGDIRYLRRDEGLPVATRKTDDGPEGVLGG